MGILVVRQIVYEYDTLEQCEKDVRNWNLAPNGKINLSNKKITSSITFRFDSYGFPVKEDESGGNASTEAEKS